METVQTLFERFGGIRPMARALKQAPATVSRWKQERRIPAQHQAFILERAAELGIEISAEDVVFPFPQDRDGVAGAAKDVSCNSSALLHRAGA